MRWLVFTVLLSATVARADPAISLAARLGIGEAMPQASGQVASLVIGGEAVAWHDVTLGMRFAALATSLREPAGTYADHAAISNVELAATWRGWLQVGIAIPLPRDRDGARMLVLADAAHERRELALFAPGGTGITLGVRGGRHGDRTHLDGEVAGVMIVRVQGSAMAERDLGVRLVAVGSLRVRANRWLVGVRAVAAVEPLAIASAGGRTSLTLGPVASHGMLTFRLALPVSGGLQAISSGSIALAATW
jgi:hypothetical protein